MKKITILALVLAVFGSCSKEATKPTNPTDTITKVATQFTNGTITRALDNKWEVDDKIGIYMIAKDAILTDANAEALDNGANVVHTVKEAGATGTLTPIQDETIYFPINGSAVDFYAYYPYQTNIVDGVYKVNVTSQADFSLIDLLATKVANKTKEEPVVAFEFAHQLSMFTMNLLAGEGFEISDLTGLIVTFEGLPTTADFNLADNSFATLANTQNIVSVTNGEGTTSQSILIPSAVVSGSRICFMLNNAKQEKFYWSIADKTFPAGKNVSYDITLNSTGIVASGSTIAEWTLEDGGTGNAN